MPAKPYDACKHQSRECCGPLCQTQLTDPAVSAHQFCHNPEPEDVTEYLSLLSLSSDGLIRQTVVQVVDMNT